MEVKNHLLYGDDGRPVEFVESPNFGGEIKPLYLIMHYTAGTRLDSAVAWFKQKKAKASAHIVIGREGEVVQMVPLNRRAWHAGKSKWGELNGMNDYSIGIELVNAGKLSRRADGTWLTWDKAVIPADDVTVARHKHESFESGWHEYTDIQIDAALKVADALNDQYQFVDILGHDDISPDRKIDPGPLFAMESFRSRVLGRV